MPNITLVFNDEGDWMGVYKDGRLAYEGHDIAPDRLLTLVEVRHGLLDNYDMGDDSRLPESEDDL